MKIKILYKYISVLFLRTTVFAILIFSLIMIIVDVIERLDKFIDKRVPFEIVTLYYFYYLPYVFILVLPVAMLMASLFTVSQLKRHGELNAVKSAGINIVSIFTPLFVIGIIVSIFAVIFGELVVPFSERLKNDLDRKYLRKTSRFYLLKKTDICIQDSQNRIVTIHFYDGTKKRAYKINVQTSKENKLVQRINAREMFKQGDFWVLKSGIIRNFEDDKEKVKEFDRLEVKDFSFSEKDLEITQVKPEEMNYFELKRYIETVKKIGGDPRKYLVDLYLKFTFPFSNLIVILLGTPLATYRWKGGVSLGFGLSLFVSFIYYVVVKLGQVMGHKGSLNPLLSASLGLIIFGIIGFISVAKIRK